MDKEKIQAEFELMRVAFDEPAKVGKYTIYPLAHIAMSKIGKYATAQQEIVNDEGIAGIIVRFNPNLKLQCKMVSIAILNNPNWLWGFIRIHLFHWIHWRILRYKLNSAQVADIFEFIVEKLGLLFFSRVTSITRNINPLKKKTPEQEQSAQKQ